MQFPYLRRTLNFITGTQKRASVTHHWTTGKLKNSIHLKAKLYSTKPYLDVNQVMNSYYNDYRDRHMEILLEPCKYHWNIPTLNINNEYIDSLNIWMKIPEDKLKLVKEVIHLYHTCIFMLDDILDHSPTRKGAPSAYKIFGLNRTLLATQAAAMQAVQKLATANNPKALQNLTTKILEYCSGTAQQMRGKNNLIRRNREDYFYVSMGIDVGYYSCILVVMQSFSNCKLDFTRLMTLFGFFARVQNDYTCLDRKEFKRIKNFAEDIAQGIHILPVILATERKTLESEIILNIVNQSSSDENLRNYCVDLMEILGTIEECKDWESYFYQMLMDEIKELGGNPEFVNVVNKYNRWKNDEVFPSHTLYENEKRQIT